MVFEDQEFKLSAKQFADKVGLTAATIKAYANDPSHLLKSRKINGRHRFRECDVDLIFDPLPTPPNPTPAKS